MKQDVAAFDFRRFCFETCQVSYQRLTFFKWTQFGVEPTKLQKFYVQLRPVLAEIILNQTILMKFESTPVYT